MATEIERKFLVPDPSFLEGIEGTRYCQGYISRAPDSTVRVRVAGDTAYLTIKGRPVGISRSEFEYEIPVQDAEELLNEFCAGAMIDKTRYIVMVDGWKWEVDIFHGANTGLTLAEIELRSEDQAFIRPDWVGEDVTGDMRYQNSQLCSTPFGTW